MDSEIQAHILDNLKDLNTSMGTLAKGQIDMNERLDKIVPWIDAEIKDTKKEVADLQKWRGVMVWKLGTLSAGAGAVLTFAAQWVAVKLGLKTH
jgi:hypothetical protein